MSADGTSGTVTVCKRWGEALYADHQGVTVRNLGSRGGRFAWAEISRFEDGTSGKDGYPWILEIVLHTGRKVPVGCTVGSPIPETLTAVRQVAARYGIPADLAGVPARDGRPAYRGLYEDPGGQPGLRYWDGGQWSPLLPPDLGRPGTARKSLGSWSALPTTEGRWAYPATHARHLAVESAVAAVLSAGLLALGLLVELYRGPHHTHEPVAGWLSIYAVAVLVAVLAGGLWSQRKYFLKLNDTVRLDSRGEAR